MLVPATPDHIFLHSRSHDHNQKIMWCQLWSHDLIMWILLFSLTVLFHVSMESCSISIISFSLAHVNCSILALSRQLHHTEKGLLRPPELLIISVYILLFISCPVYYNLLYYRLFLRGFSFTHKHLSCFLVSVKKYIQPFEGLSLFLCSTHLLA